MKATRTDHLRRLPDLTCQAHGPSTSKSRAKTAVLAFDSVEHTAGLLESDLTNVALHLIALHLEDCPGRQPQRASLFGSS